MREFLEQLFQMGRYATCSSSSSGSSSSSSQERGKGVAPEAGPWHGAAGLRVKPERAALRRHRRLVAIAVVAMPPQAVPFARLVCILGHPLARQAASARLRIGAEVDRMT